LFVLVFGSKASKFSIHLSRLYTQDINCLILHSSGTEFIYA